MAKAEKKVFNPELLAAMHAEAPLNYDKAMHLAAQYGEKVRSVIAKAGRDKIPYEKIVRVRKDGKPVASKESTVATIEEILGLTEGSLTGLEKAAKASLEKLRDALPAVEAE